MDESRMEDSARVQRSEDAITEDVLAKARAAEESAGPGDKAGVFLVRVTLRRTLGNETPAPEIDPLEGAIEAALLTRFPDFSPSARAERVDR